jgi:hypothetical protein
MAEKISLKKIPTNLVTTGMENDDANVVQAPMATESLCCRDGQCEGLLIALQAHLACTQQPHQGIRALHPRMGFPYASSKSNSSGMYYI